MKRLLLFLLLIVSTCFLNAQTWEKTYPYSLGNVMLGATDYEYDEVNGGLILGWGESGSKYDAWLLRIDTNGDTLWTQRWDSTNIWFSSTATARLSTGNYLVGGCYWDTLAWRNAISYKEIDPAGNVIAINTFPLNTNQMGPTIDAGFQNDYIITYQNDSFASGTGNFLYHAIIERHSNSGTLLWQKNYINLGNYVYASLVRPTCDGGAVIFWHDTGISTYHSALDKIDGNGNVTWSKDLRTILGLPGNTNFGIQEIIPDTDSSLIMSVNYTTDSINTHQNSFVIRFDPYGNLLDSISFNDMAIMKGVKTSNNKYLFNYSNYFAGVTSASGMMFLDNNLNYISTHPYPLSENSANYKLIANNIGGAFLCFGNFVFGSQHLFACNFDSLFNTYPEGIKGGVFLDNNTNCNNDAPDFPICNSMITLHKTSGTNYYAYANNGEYTIHVPYGNYSINHSSQPNKVLECPLSGYNYSLFSDTTILNTNFFDTLVSGLNDLEVMQFPENFVPGFTTNLEVYCHNAGTVIANTTLKFIKDDSVQFISSVPPPNSIIGDTLFYTIGPLYFDSVGIISIQFKTNSTVMLGTNLKFIASFPSIGDITPSNNSDTLERVVIGAFDPNEKDVNQPYYFNGTNQLIYKVRFQNTGTLAAKNVVVVDTVDTDLDLSTFKVLSKSHIPMNVQFGTNNKVTFNFMNINLPDSTTNEAGSHGEFVYSIKPKPGLSIGTQIKNKAYIYFDYNAPIITNTTTNIVADSNVGIAEAEKNDEHIAIFPNPTTNFLKLLAPKEFKSFKIECIDITGRTLFAKNYTNQTTAQNIDISNLVSGIYLLKITNENYLEVKKLIINR